MMRCCSKDKLSINGATPVEKEICHICPSKLSKRELQDLYFKLMQDNVELKQTVNQLNDKARVQTTRLQRMLAVQKACMSNDPKECCIASKAILQEQKNLIEDLKNDNENLKAQLKNLNMKLCSTKQFLSRPPSAPTPRDYSTKWLTSGRIKNHPGPNVARKDREPDSAKNSTSSANTKISEVPTTGRKSTSSLRPERSVPNSPKSDRKSKMSPKSETAPNKKTDNSNKFCDQNKCRTQMEEFQQKILDLQKELSKTHEEYSDRIARLEHEVVELHSENMRVRTEKTLWEHTNNARENEANEIKKKLAENEAYSQGLSTRLNIEKSKVAELKTRIKAANMTNGAVRAIEERLLNDNITKEIPTKFVTNDITNLKKDDRRSFSTNREIKKDLKKDSNKRRDSNAINEYTTVGSDDISTKRFDPYDNSKPGNSRNEQKCAPKIEIEENCCKSTESPKKITSALQNDNANVSFLPTSNMNPNSFDAQWLNNGQTGASSNGTSRQSCPKITMKQVKECIGNNNNENVTCTNSQDKVTTATDSGLGDTGPKSNRENLRSPDKESITPNLLSDAKYVDVQCGNQTDDVVPPDMISCDKRSSIRVQADENGLNNFNRLSATKDSLTVVKKGRGSTWSEKLRESGKRDKLQQAQIEHTTEYPPPDETRRTSIGFSTTSDSPKTQKNSFSENKTTYFGKKDIIAEGNEKQEEVASSPIAKLVDNSNESSCYCSGRCQCVNTTRRGTPIGDTVVPVFAPTQSDGKESPLSEGEQTILQKFVALFTPVNEDEIKMTAKTNQPLMDTSEQKSFADVSTVKTADTSIAKPSDTSHKPDDTSSSIETKHIPKAADVSIANTTDTSTARTTDDDSGFNEVSKNANSHVEKDSAEVNARTTDTKAAAKVSEDLGIDESNKNAMTDTEKGLARVNQDLMNKVAELQAQLDQLRVHVLSRKDTYVILKDDATPNYEDVTKDTGITTTSKEYSSPSSPSNANCESTCGMEGLTCTIECRSRKTSDDSYNEYKRRNSQRKDDDNRYQIPGPIPVAAASRKTQSTNLQRENMRQKQPYPTHLQSGGSNINLDSNRQITNFHERSTKKQENLFFVKEESPTTTNPTAPDSIEKLNAQFVKKPQEVLEKQCCRGPQTLDNLNTRETAYLKPEQITVADANVNNSTALAEKAVETRDPKIEQGIVKTLKNAKGPTKHCLCPTALKSPMKCQCCRNVEYTMNVIHTCTAPQSAKYCRDPKIYIPQASSKMKTEDILSSNVLPFCLRRNSNIVTNTNGDVVGSEQKPDQTHNKEDKSEQSIIINTNKDDQKRRESQNSLKPIDHTQFSTDPLLYEENKIKYENRTLTSDKTEQMTEPPMALKSESRENQVDKKVTPQKCASVVTSTPKQLGGQLTLEKETSNLQRTLQSDGDGDKGTSPRTYTIPLAPADVVQDAPDKKAIHENTDEEISSMTDLPSEKETMTSPHQDIQSCKKELSLGEDRTTTATSTSCGVPASINPKTTSFSLSEGEMPHYSTRSSLKRDDKTDQALIDERQTRMDKSEILEKALVTISEELARCRRLLSRPRETPSTSIKRLKDTRMEEIREEKRGTNDMKKPTKRLKDLVEENYYTPNNPNASTQCLKQYKEEDNKMSSSAITMKIFKDLKEEKQREDEKKLQENTAMRSSFLHKASDHAIELHRAEARPHISQGPDTPHVMFTLHIGTAVLSDEAVINSRNLTLVLTWKFYDQNVAMSHMRPGRVVHFDFSTEYDLQLTDHLLQYMKNEELAIKLCEVNKLDDPLASCALPLREPLLHTNRRADMSLALVAGPQMQRSSKADPLDTRDEMGVLDLWCMLRADQRILPLIKKAISKGRGSSANVVNGVNGNQASMLSNGLNQPIMPDDDQDEFRSSAEADPAYYRTKHESQPNDPMGNYRRGAVPFSLRRPNSSRLSFGYIDPSVAGHYKNNPGASYPQHRPSVSLASGTTPDQKSNRDPAIHPVQHETLSSSTKNIDEKGLAVRKESSKKSASGFIISEVPTCIKSGGEMKQIVTERSKGLSGRTSLGHTLQDKYEQAQNSLKPAVIEQRDSYGQISLPSIKSLRDPRSAENRATASEIGSVSAKDMMGFSAETLNRYWTRPEERGRTMDSLKSVTIKNEPKALTSNIFSEDRKTAADEEATQTVEITILWLALNEECRAMNDANVQRLYVAYNFLGHSGAELETPMALPKPKQYQDKCYFNFRKSFVIHDEDKAILRRMARYRSPRQGTPNPNDCVVFTIVSEPVEDPLGLNNCEDIGIAHLFFGDLLVFSAGSDSYTDVIPIQDSDTPEDVICGVLAIRVDGLDVVRKCLPPTPAVTDASA